MDLSVVVCTYNRERLLQGALEQMCRLHVPEGVEWELLVVDNGSTDGTDLVIDTFAGRLPLRKLREDRPGKSFALNHAVAGARGAYLVFTDDDVLVGPNWLAAYAAAFQQWPGDAVFGGPIAALFEGTPPRWLGETRDIAHRPAGSVRREYGHSCGRPRTLSIPDLAWSGAWGHGAW
jgi:glycosyltransferase involved in cell wall biosynthesis